MADNYTRGGQSFRSEDKSSVQFPVVLAGAHVRTYIGTQSLTVTNTSQTLTVPSGAEFADIYVEGTSSTDFVRFWHGATPTAAVGQKAKDHEVISSASPSTFRAILGSGSGTCTLRVDYYVYS